MFGIAFDNKGNGIVTENGEALYDEINLLKPGGNYGFPMLQPMGKAPELANSSSIPPIRSYKSTITPTQAIYYLGEKFPLLKNKFVYGAYNGPELYALELNASSKRVSKELLLDIGADGPIIALAYGPNGDLYFGGNKIYKLETLDRFQDKQIMFPIQLTSSDDVEVRNLAFQPSNNSVVIYFHAQNSTGGKTSFLHIKIPKELIEGISNATIVGTYKSTEEKRPSYLIRIPITKFRTHFNLVNVDRLSPSDYQLLISGTKVSEAG